MTYKTTIIERNLHQRDTPLQIKGDLVIQGDILEKSEITVGGNLKVFGGIQQAKIETRRHLIVEQGIAHGSEVVVNGSTKSGFIEKSTVYSRGDIIIQNSAMRAELNAGRNIILSNGIIVGGTAWASEKIVAQRIGSSAGIVTSLSVGIHPKIRRNCQKIQVLMKQLETDLEALNKNILFLEDADVSTLSSRSHQLYQRLPEMKSKQKQQKQQQKQSRHNLAQLLKLAKSRHPTDPHILVHDTVFEKVKIEIGWHQFPVTELFQKVAFKIKNGHIYLADLA